ncbi:MAG: DUF3095 domain-containing protein [Armatimonadetes bacterium]|nr:DUF3095 domain-containing protein [Anaerolineae bacterium]
MQALEQVDFFQNIPAMERIADITTPSHYHPVPADWHIALTDIVGSTKAIEAGKYRDVNTMAAASITALLNRLPRIDIPFTFGGDGATILIPPSVVTNAQYSLLATQQLAREYFGLEMRVGIVPVQTVYDAGYSIRVARLRMSDNFHQAIFAGGGIGYAEKLLKDPQHSANYLLNAMTGRYEADFTGFECRWNAVRSPSEETVSLLITATDADPDAHNAIYRDALAAIERIYGDRFARHPITREKMRMSLNPFKLRTEAKIRYEDLSPRRIWWLLWNTFKAQIAMRFNIQEWGSYPQLLIESADNEKFDDTLRMIISGKVKQREQLRAYLEQKRQAGELVYGTHAAQSALVTCIVFDHFGRQVHFVDGADGGYALAAKELKSQMRALDGYPAVTGS